MQSNTSVRRRFIQNPWWFLWFGIIFMIVWYGVYFFWKQVGPSSYSDPQKIINTYNVYIPLAIGFLSILVSSVLWLIFYLVRLRYFLAKILIYLLIYGFWLGFAIQLHYFEPRYTEIAIAIIDTISWPLLVASGTILWAVFILSFVTVKSNVISIK